MGFTVSPTPQAQGETKVQFEIKARITGRVLFTAEIPDDTEEFLRVRAALTIAVKARADLSGADLSGADLSGADLSGADLSGADLSGAYLSGADLSGADLSGADLSGADLSGADLRGADLSGADLSGADLSGADLSGADLRGAYLSGADLSGADLSGADLIGANLSGADLSGANLIGANLSGAKNLPIPSTEEIARLDAVREIVLAKPERLEMRTWHSGNWTPEHTPEEEHECGSAHCIAGWLQALSPDKAMREMDAEHAGIKLAPASSYMFYASDAVALAWLKDRGYAKVAEAQS